MPYYDKRGRCFSTSLPDLKETMVANRVKDWRILCVPHPRPGRRSPSHLPPSPPFPPSPAPHLTQNGHGGWGGSAYPKPGGRLPHKMTDAECLEYLVPHLHRHEHVEKL